MALGKPLRPSLLFRYGQFLMLLKRHSRALEVFRAAARENPRHHHQQAWSCIAFLLAEREELAAAIDAKVDRAWYSLGLCLARLGRRDKQRAEYERIRVEFGVQPK